MTKASIQKLIAQDQVPSALEQMMALLNAYLLLHPKDQAVAKLHTILITNSGKYRGLEQDQALGILKREDAQVTLAEVKKAILYLLDELPEQVWQTKPSVADTNELTHPEKAIEARLKEEQTQLEQAASLEVRAKPLPPKADLTAVKNSALLIDFYQKYGEKPTPQFYQLHETIIQIFGDISELELDDLIADLAKEDRERTEQERKRIAIIEVEIPQTIRTFVAENKGEWARRQELTLLDELSRHFNGILAKSDFVTMLDEARENFLKLKDFVFIKGGTFLMGAPKGEPASNDREKPQHQVQASDFYLSKYPVTLAQFETFIQATEHQTDADRNGGSNFWTGSKWESKAGVNWHCDVNGQPQTDKQHPVIHVSWNDARAYCSWLAEQLKMPVRLPYEAEWEYACRAGMTSPFNTGANLTTDQANYNGNYPYPGFPKGRFLQNTTPVGVYAPNAWGLYDMHGNVWEWCEDWYSETYYHVCAKHALVIDPKGAGTGSVRILRGGSWLDDARACRAADRGRFVPEFRDTAAGFRPAISL